MQKIWLKEQEETYITQYEIGDIVFVKEYKKSFYNSLKNKKANFK